MVGVDQADVHRSWPVSLTQHDAAQVVLDVPFAETLVRHATKPDVVHLGEAELRSWYRPLDLLPGGIETVIGADSPLEATIARIMSDTGLAGLSGQERERF